MLFMRSANKKVYMEEAKRLVNMLNLTIREREEFFKVVEGCIVNVPVTQKRVQKDVKWALKSFLSRYSSREVLEMMRDNALKEILVRALDEGDVEAEGVRKLIEERLLSRYHLSASSLREDACKNGYGVVLVQRLIEAA